MIRSCDNEVQSPFTPKAARLRRASRPVVAYRRGGPFKNATMRTLKLTNSDLVAVVDDSDFELLSKYKWRLDNRGYPVTGNPKRDTFASIHKMLMPAPDGFMVDHIDRNRMNNTRANLRLATKQQNAANSKMRADNTSGYRGVSFFRRDSNWRASIRVNGREKNLGYYDTPELAAEAYNKHAAIHFGEFAALNKIPTQRATALHKVLGKEEV